MIDLDVSQILRDRLAVEFPECYVGTPLSGEEISLPAILLGIESDVVVGSPLQRGTLTVSVQSSAADTAVEAHAAFSQEVDAFIRAQSIASGAVVMWPPVAQRVANQQPDTRWSTDLSYVIGMQRV